MNKDTQTKILYFLVVGWLWWPIAAHSQLITPPQDTVIQERLAVLTGSQTCTWQKVLDAFEFKLYHFKQIFRSEDFPFWYLKYKLYRERIDSMPAASAPCRVGTIHVERKETQELKREIRNSLLNQYGYYYHVSWRPAIQHSADHLVWISLYAFIIDDEVSILPDFSILKTLKK
jgi:hypothetical protein